MVFLPSVTSLATLIFPALVKTHCLNIEKIPRSGQGATLTLGSEFKNPFHHTV